MPLPARVGPPAADAEGGAPARPRKRRKCSVDDFFASSGDETGNEDEDEEPERDELKEYLALERGADQHEEAQQQRREPGAAIEWWKRENS